MTMGVGFTRSMDAHWDGERRHSLTLLRIADALRPLSDADEIMFTACRILGEHLGANRVFYATIVDEAIALIMRDYVDGVPSMAGRLPLDVFGAEMTDLFRRGEELIVDDAQIDPRFPESSRAPLAELSIGAGIATPLVKDGRLVGTFSVHSAVRRTWTADEVALLRETAERTWAALERAQAQAAHRESEERYVALFEQSPIATALTRLANGVIVDANRAFVDLFELDRREIIGKTSVELGISVDLQHALVGGELNSAGAVREIECTRTTKSGAQRIVLLDVIPVTAGGERYLLAKVRDITAQRRAVQFYEQSRERLLDLEAMERLHRVSTRFFGEEGLQGALDEIVDAAIAVTQADFGHIQVLDPRSGDLEIVAPRGFAAWWIDYWNRIAKGRGSCGTALERKERVIVEDVTRHAIFASSEDLDVQLRANVFACQSTPLLDRSGVALGMISTHYKSPRRPSDRALRLLDLLARQAADILDRARRDAEERRREEEQRVLADIGGALSTLDYEHALSSVTRIVAESFGDFAVIYLVEAGTVRRVAAASRAAEHAWIPKAMLVTPPQSQPLPTHPVWEVIATRRSRIRDVDPSQFESLAESPTHLAGLRSADARSALLAPMVIGNSCVGAIGLTSSVRRLDERDTALIEEIGRRCALFIENARLHEREQRAIRARSEVLGIVAHDLRNPLHSIMVNAQIAQQQAGDTEGVDLIRRAATRMTHIINDLLDVARFDAGTLEIDRAQVLVADLVAEAERAHRTLVEAQGLELRLAVAAELPPVWADTERVAQVFENLIANAMKFTTSGTITIGASSRGADILFSVADTGSGIAAGDLPRVFEPFWQALQHARGGAGLGLSIVKTIVEAHDGQVWVTSDVGAGSTFFFTLPSAATSDAVSTPVADAATPSDPLVLIVDDDKDLRRALARMLRAHGYATATAANGQEALDYLSHGESPAVIVLDLAMPVLDGWAFLEQRKQRSDLGSIPVIVISGQDAVAKRVAAMNATLLQKPVSPEDLLAAMPGVAF